LLPVRGRQVARREGPDAPPQEGRYEFHKVHTDGWVCDPGGGGCIPSDKRRWSPHHWRAA
jgi:hypothetical protein